MPPLQATPQAASLKDYTIVVASLRDIYNRVNDGTTPASYISDMLDILKLLTQAARQGHTWIQVSADRDFTRRDDIPYILDDLRQRGLSVTVDTFDTSLITVSFESSDNNGYGPYGYDHDVTSTYICQCTPRCTPGMQCPNQFILSALPVQPLLNRLRTYQ